MRWCPSPSALRGFASSAHLKSLCRSQWVRLATRRCGPLKQRHSRPVACPLRAPAALRALARGMLGYNIKLRQACQRLCTQLAQDGEAHQPPLDRTHAAGRSWRQMRRRARRAASPLSHPRVSCLLPLLCNGCSWSRRRPGRTPQAFCPISSRSTSCGCPHRGGVTAGEITHWRGLHARTRHQPNHAISGGAVAVRTQLNCLNGFNDTGCGGGPQRGPDACR